ncbi:MAG: hypothetical protein J6W27_02225 [Alphaproteobacteria bacterium]|nr:hypothetical protein [Alphaproteobacteria bacterium]
MNTLNFINVVNKNNSDINHICEYLALNIAKVCLNSKSGHLGASLSSLQLMTTLYFGGFLKFSLKNPRHPDRDRVLLRGHLGPLRYSLFSLLNWVKPEELLTYRFINSRLQGHECMFEIPGIDITPSGSLGMVLSYGIGSAIVSKQRKHTFKTWVFLGDGEEQEGNVSEAARYAANQNLSNLICILDKNGKQLSRPVSDFNSHSDIAMIWRGYGWNVIEINGHDINEIKKAYQVACTYKKKPTLIIAHTIKGNGLHGEKENFCGYHTISNCPHDIVRKMIYDKETILQSSNVTRDSLLKIIKKNTHKCYVAKTVVRSPKYVNLSLDSYKNVGQHEATTYYYRLLSKYIKDNHVNNFYFLTADLMQKDSIIECNLQDIKNYYDVGLREQHMYAMAHGISVTDPEARIHINATEAFSFRALDQVHAASQGKSHMIITADKSGIANSRNGSTHQSVSQSFSFNWLNNSTFLEPSDAEDFFSCMNYAFVNNDSLFYIRCHSVNSDHLPKIGFVPNKINPWYEIGHKKVIEPDIILVTSGITSTFAYNVLPILREHKIEAKIINITAPNMLDQDFVKQFTKDKPCLCIYNGHPDFLPACISSTFFKYPNDNKPCMIVSHGFLHGCSGTFDELKKYFQFDEQSLLLKIKDLVKKS